jgi:hypothetical protein
MDKIMQFITNLIICTVTILIGITAALGIIALIKMLVNFIW